VLLLLDASWKFLDWPYGALSGYNAVMHC